MMTALSAALDWACSQSAQFHDSGNLHPYVLKAISNHGQRIGASETAETGCGLSTVVMSALAERHTCFTVAAGNSLERVQQVPQLRRENVNFVIGPSQLTLPAYGFPRAFDMVLIDGPHGFPFAQMEYFYFYQRLRPGGVLIIDDIHIPTVRQMYDFLRDDAMWGHLEDVLTTAFFYRTDAPLFDPFGDGWEKQQFNQRHFKDPSLLDFHVPGWQEKLRPAPAPLLGQDPNEQLHLSGVIEAGRLHEEISALRGEIAALRASTSWRVTAPMRALATLAKRR